MNLSLFETHKKQASTSELVYTEIIVEIILLPTGYFMTILFINIFEMLVETSSQFPRIDSYRRGKNFYFNWTFNSIGLASRANFVFRIEWTLVF